MPRKPQPVVRPVTFKREVVMCDDLKHFYLVASSLNLKSLHYNAYVLDFGPSRVTLWMHKTWSLDASGLALIRRTLEKWIYAIEKCHACFVDLESETIDFDV